MIHTKDLSKTFKKGIFRKPIVAVQSVNLNISSGEICGFIGPNGAGKSTTIKLILGLVKPTTGEVLINGVPIDKSKVTVGYLPENSGVYNILSGREYLKYFASLSFSKNADQKKRIEEVIHTLNIESKWLDAKMETFSKGMVQMFGLAQAIIGKPKLLILDEPMSGLDPVARSSVVNLIKKLKGESTTIFYSSHNLSEVEKISDNIAIIVRGEVSKQIQKNELENNDLERILFEELEKGKFHE